VIAAMEATPTTSHTVFARHPDPLREDDEAIGESWCG
jgi:hypothetical protein